MRIRLPFAGGFAFLLLVAGYAGLSSLQVDVLINDKALHFVTFFVLTVVFYWIVDTNRRRTLNLTLAVCTLGLGIGSEFLQALLPNGGELDLFDLVANVVGSLVGLGLCSWYHKRMLERKRMRKNYTAVSGEDIIEEDLELGEGIGAGPRSAAALGQEEGIIVGGTSSTSASAPAAPTPASAQRTTTLEEEVDNWDENAEDAWDDDDDLGDIGVAGNGDTTKKR